MLTQAGIGNHVVSPLSRRLFPLLSVSAVEKIKVKTNILIWITCKFNILHKINLSALRERLRTHKFFTKDQCFYLNYHKFSIKSYVLDVY